MVTTAALTENSRQGINFEIPPCIGTEAWLSRNLRPGCGYAYDETPVGLVVYVRNDPVNYVDPDGRMAAPLDRQWLEPFTYTFWNFSEREGEITGVLLYSYTVFREAARGGPDPQTAWRQQFLNNVLGENNKNVLDRINGDCAAFIDAMNQQLQPGLENMSAHDWVSWRLIGTVQWDLEGHKYTGRLGPGGSYAETDGNTIHLGEVFFDDNDHDDVLTIIHELFHLSAVSVDGTNKTHLELLQLAESAGYSTSGPPSAEFRWNNLMRTECGKK
jgi:hypothetical protein